MTFRIRPKATTFEFWLGASFAVVVAVHAARESITRELRLALTCLYLFFVLSTLVKTWADMHTMAMYEAYLTEDNIDVRSLPNILVMVTRVTIYLLGSATVVWYIRREIPEDRQ